VPPFSNDKIPFTPIPIAAALDASPFIVVVVEAVDKSV
jgi:hypothetical protein